VAWPLAEPFVGEDVGGASPNVCASVSPEDLLNRIYNADDTTLARLWSVLRKRTEWKRSAGLLGLLDAKGTDTSQYEMR
jgi:hypothetical protein